MPANAVHDSPGKGWRCRFGFRKSRDGCQRIIPPANGALNRRGDGWVCRAMYERVGNRCIAKQVPLGARIVPGVDSWQCRRGYKMVAGICRRVLLPKNADYDKTSGWQCQKGYHRRGAGCERSVLPANARWQDQKKGLWECRKGYFRSGRRCISHPIPQYAQPSDTEPLGYRCRHGYRSVGGQCVKLEIPRYAMLTSDGNNWECMLGYQRRDRRCVPIAYRTTYLKNEYFTDTMLCGKRRTRTVTGVCGGSYVVGNIQLCSKNQFFKGEIYYTYKKYRSEINGKQLQTGMYTANDTLGNYCELGLN
jgi:hypothetical protein